VFHQLQDGLDYLHDNGVVHAGLSRESVLLDATGNVKIVDLLHSVVLGGRCAADADGRSPAVDVRFAGASLRGFVAGVRLLCGRDPYVRVSPKKASVLARGVENGVREDPDDRGGSVSVGAAAL